MASPPPRIIFNNFSGQSNVAFITTRPNSNYSVQLEQNNTQQAILAVGVPVLVNSLQLKYQGKSDSPFDTNPKTMAIAIASFLIYCLGCEVVLRIHSAPLSSTYANLIRQVVRLFGYFALASFVSILFSTTACSIQPAVVYVVFALLFSAGLLLQRWVQNRTPAETMEGYVYNNLSRRIEAPLIRPFVNDIELPV